MKCFVLGVLFITCSLYATGDKDFIVAQPEKKTNLSKNKLKEKIGTCLKDALDETTSLVDCCGTILQSDALSAQTIGEMLTEIASMQQRYTSSVEKLIDNRRPFKTATRDKLDSTHTTLSDVVGKLSSQRSACRACIKSGKGKKRSYSDLCRGWKEELSLINSRLACNDCLV